MLEPHRTSTDSTSIPCKDVVREGSVMSNHPEPMYLKSIYLPLSVRMYLVKV